MEAIRRPEYLWRPSQILRRLRKGSLCASKALQFSWGLPVDLDHTSHIGVDVINIGLHDRVVPESICRLLDPGESAYDIGANVGQNASIMALTSGSHGHVIAFEPSPVAWDFLARNVASWAPYALAPIELVRKGLSSRLGNGVLREMSDLGAFSLEEESLYLPREERARRFEIDLTTLDAFVPEGARIGLMKIDVEGHEPAVLEGAQRVLAGKQVRDIVFEDYHPQPSPVTRLLEAAGYHVFGMVRAWHKPLLLTLDERSKVAEPGFETNFLATCDPDRARSRFRNAGWKCLRVKARRVPAGRG